MISTNERAEHKEAIAEMSHKIKSKGIAAVSAEYSLHGEGEAATFILEPVKNALRSMYQDGEGDAELSKLDELRANTNYGQYLFSEKAMDILFGPGRKEEWKAFHLPPSEQDPFSVKNVCSVLVSKQVLTMMRQGSRRSNGSTKYVSDVTDAQWKSLREHIKATNSKAPRSATAEETEDEDILGRWFG